MTPERTLVPKFFAKPRLRGMKPADETAVRARVTRREARHATCF
jgi:hypothetical protein